MLNAERRLPNYDSFVIMKTMENNTTSILASTIISRDRFNYLKTLFHQAPLSDSAIRELKILAKKFDPEMAKWMDENKELC